MGITGCFKPNLLGKLGARRNRVKTWKTGWKSLLFGWKRSAQKVLAKEGVVAVATGAKKKLILSIGTIGKRWLRESQTLARLWPSQA